MKVWETSGIAFLSHIKIIENIFFVDFFSDEYLLRLYFGGFGDVGARSTKYCISRPLLFAKLDFNFANSQNCSFEIFPTHISCEFLFHLEKKIDFFRTPRSIPNLPKIPKIILRKSSEQAKAVKNPNSKFLDTG